MKNIILCIALLFASLDANTLLANSKYLEADSSLFENQRQRVNMLLEERSRKFGEYDQSLQQRTGIFGLFKSKSDMQKSIDILQAIVINDNNIFIETRKLLDLKDTERDRFQLLATEFDNQVTAYMKTVSKLQQENERLQLQIKELQSDEHNSNLIFYLLALLFAGMAILIYKLYQKLQTAKN